MSETFRAARCHRPHNRSKPSRLTVRLLVPRAGTGTSELLGLAPPVVGNEQCAVVLDEGLLQLVLRVLVDVFLVVGDDGLRDGLADGVDLRGVTTTGDADADVDISWVTWLAFSFQTLHFPHLFIFELEIRPMVRVRVYVRVSEGYCGEKSVRVPNLSTPRMRTGS